MIKLHTNYGVITVNLFEDKAPETTANFKEYVKSGHYDGTIFHRVISNFMIQGGGFEPGMSQKPTRAPIKNEAANGLKNDAYTIAMARTSVPDSATAQFFINVSNNSFLNFTPHPARLWLCRVRQGDGRQGSRGRHQENPYRQPRRPSGRANGRHRHNQGGNCLNMVS